jgi:hypothetical protein
MKKKENCHISENKILETLFISFVYQLIKLVFKFQKRFATSICLVQFVYTTLKLTNL